MEVEGEAERRTRWENNVAYGVPKYTATRNNKLLVVSFLAKGLLFRVAVYFGPRYPTLAVFVSLSLAPYLTILDRLVTVNKGMLVFCPARQS